ncbi:MAG: thiamine pyrophosphate-dependent enzyme [Bacteroidota bacterium]
MKKLLMGDEALAQGAIDAGLSGMYAYPGTPSTEIMEYIQHSNEAKGLKIHMTWSSNEKTSMEAALGMSYAGKRAMVAMKHVGLNVAADAFINSAITGVNGGLVVVSADDPSMHSSQNEQDSRFYGKFAQIPILEPSNQQEAYEMVIYGFELSEKLKVPVLLRITTRLAHSRAGVETIEKRRVQNDVTLPEDPNQFILLPSIARMQYKELLGKFDNFIDHSEESPYNQYFEGKDKSKGVIACGITYNYLMENFPEGIDFPLLKITQYPMPRKKVEHIMSECDEVIVLEDGYPMIEELLKGYLGNEHINGRLDGTLPRAGELNPNIVGKAFGFVTEEIDVPGVVEKRLPAMCVGCGHIDAYNALNVAMEEYGKGKVFADIGCYTLGAYEPFNAISSCVDMGASITMAKGAADAGLTPAVAVIGDSTFTHSGMTGLLDAVKDSSNITVVISDNFTTGMTGGQDSNALGKIEDICRGIGVDEEHIRIFKPLAKNHDEMVRIMKEEISYNGVSVVIPRRQCVRTIKNKKLSEEIKKLGLN